MLLMEVFSRSGWPVLHVTCLTLIFTSAFMLTNEINDDDNDDDNSTNEDEAEK